MPLRLNHYKHLNARSYVVNSLAIESGLMVDKESIKGLTCALGSITVR